MIFPTIGDAKKQQMAEKANRALMNTLLDH